jgi:pantoate--beta-alanine ligase
MKTVSSIPDLREYRSTCKGQVGFVPTMGYLHEGHLSLVRKAHSDCDTVVVSIFVNPTQFAHNEDINTYPQDIARDLKILDKTQNVDLVWIPKTRELYPPDFQSWVNVDEVTLPLEGKFRPEHFRGVTTIVAKLFNCVRPNYAYFGQKDFQQAVVIQRMVKDLNIPIEVVVCPTIREADGLAMSSRNANLNPEQRKAATVLNRALVKAFQVFESGEREADTLRTIVIDTILEEPLAQLQYVSCADLETLVEQNGMVERCLLSIAVYFGKTRLIDNLLIGD